MTNKMEVSIEELELGELRERIEMYEEAGIFDELSAYAVQVGNNQKHHLKIKNDEKKILYVLLSQRGNVRELRLDTASKNLNEFGFSSFTVLITGDVTFD